MDEQTPGLPAFQNLGINFSPLALLGGFVFSVVGLYYFREGRKRHYRKTTWVGVVLMSYPLFVSPTPLIWCLGLFFSVLAYYFKMDGQ